MFKRVILEDWQNLIPVIAFGFAFAVFIVLSLCAILMKREKADHLARLPLDKDQPTNQNH